jgi:hypothetical protein
LIVLIGAGVSAQQLIYFEGDVRVYERVNTQLFELQDSIDGFISFGYELDSNYVVKTFDGAAEIVLPNGHLLRMDSDTEIQLDSVLARGARTGSDVVSVAAGRLRSVVSNLTGTGRGFQVRTPTAVGGVRGTDFATIVADGLETIAVLEGVVDFTNALGEQIQLLENQFANALGDTFAAMQSANIAEQFYGSLDNLSDQARALQRQLLSQAGEPDPDPEPEPDPEPDPDPDPEGEGEPGPDDSSGDAGGEEGGDPTSVPPVSVESVATGGEPEDEGDVSAGAEGGGPIDTLIAGLTDALGFEIGTVTLEGETYSKVIAQPNFSIGPLRVGLYLPIIYTGNLFDASQWYRPRGNNEWSFGFDQDWAGAPLVAAGDVLADLALKIRYLEWGDQRDPFFIKVGNLNTMTLGHGLLMRNYANDTDFPTVRRLGFNVGIDFGRVGFEALTNDLARPEIFGARLYARPFGSFPLAFGVSGVADIGPARDLPSEADEVPVFETERETDPVFVNLAVDLDFPIIQSELATLIAYGDVGGMVPYLRNSSGGLDAGMRWDVLTGEDASDFRNYGIAAGITGNLTLLDYRLEFQNYHGVFQPAFFDSSYDRTRGERTREVIAYLQNPTAEEYDNQTIGVFGEAGINFADLVRLDAGYMWPFTRDPDTNQIVTDTGDEVNVELSIQDGLLPYGITAGAGYYRTNLVPMLLGSEGFEEAGWFDEYTVAHAWVIYPISPIMSIVGNFSMQYLRDEEGNLQYEERGGTLRPVVGPVVTIETRLGEL